jgi:hypothetical protein
VTVVAAQQAQAILERQACGQARCACMRSQRRGAGLTHCPVHQDPHPSLSVTVKDERLLVHCQATCQQADVVASLKEKQLWPEPAAATVPNGRERTVVATYDYRGGDGDLVFQTLRFFPKNFSQRRPDGHGGWVWNLKDVQPVLYRLPELIAADAKQTVYVVEGEKDVDRLRAGGLMATSSPMGAGKWRAAYAEALRGRRVVILPDNDQPGHEHARTILRSLHGVAESARIVELPGLAEHGDVSDWLDTHTLDDLRAECSPAPKTWNAADLLKRILPEPRWAIPGLIAEGLSVLAGRPKFGKSWVALQMALAVAYGGRALSQVQVEQGEVLYLALEDNERRLQARLRKLVKDGPGPKLLDLQAVWPRLDDGGLEAIEAWLDEHPRARLVVLDTWTLIRPRPQKGVDPYFEDTNAARRLKALADSRHIAIIALHHTRKPFLGGAVSDFLDEVLGSSGLTAAADSVLVLQRERGHTDGVLHLTGRDILEDARSLNWDDDTGWSLGGTAEEARIGRERRDVLDALRLLDEPATPSELAVQLGRNVNAVKKLLWQMSRDAQVMNDGRGHYSAPIPADAGYMARKNGNLGNPGNFGNPGNQGDLVTPISNDGNRVTGEVDGDAAPVTEERGTVTQSEFRVTRLPGLPSRARTREQCAACGKELGDRELHWPWLHDNCTLPPAASGASP